MSTEVSNPNLAVRLAPPSLAAHKGLVWLALLPMTYALFGAAWMAFVPVMQELTASLQVDARRATLLITIISMAKSVVPIATGIIAARVGLRKTLIVAGVLCALGALAPWMPDYAAMIALRFVLGVGGAMWVTLMGSVVLSEIDSGKRPLANAVNGIAVNVGVIAALAFTLPMVQQLGLQMALSTMSVGIVLCVACAAWLGPMASDQQRQQGQPVADLLRAYAQTLRVSSTWWLALAFCGPLALYLVLNTFLGQHLSQAFSLTRADAMRWLSFMNLCGVPAAIGAGMVLARAKRAGHDATKPLLIAAALLLPLGVVWAVRAPDDATRAIAFALAGIGTFLPVSPLVSALQGAPGQTPARLGMIFGTMFAVTYLVSAAVPTIVADLIARGFSLSSALTVAALLGVTPLFGLFLMRRPK